MLGVEEGLKTSLHRREARLGRLKAVLKRLQKTKTKCEGHSTVSNEVGCSNYEHLCADRQTVVTHLTPIVFNGVDGGAVGPGSARGNAFIPHSEPATFGDMPPWHCASVMSLPLLQHRPCTKTARHLLVGQDAVLPRAKLSECGAGGSAACRLSIEFSSQCLGNLGSI